MNTVHETPLPDIEARLRAEYAGRAGNATGADRILTTLARQPAPMRARRAPSAGGWAAVAAVVAIVAAIIPIGLHLADHPPATTADPASQDVVYYLTYQPGWLPDHYVTNMRRSSVHGADQSWGWYDDSTLPGPIAPSIQLDVLSTATQLGRTQADGIAAGQPTTINGHPAAVVDQQQDFATVTWQPNQDTVLQVSGLGVPDLVTTLEKVATSVVPADPAVPIRATAGMRFGALPTGYQPFEQGASGTPDHAARTIGAGDGSVDTSQPDLTAQLFPQDAEPPTNGGTISRVDARGRPGSFTDSGDQRSVQVQLGDGSWLLVQSSSSDNGPSRSGLLSEQQLVAIANGVTIDPTPDLNWLGR